MSGLYNDAALSVDKTQFVDAFGNPLGATDLPFDDPFYVGYADEAFNIVVADNPGVTAVDVKIAHTIAAWQSGEVVTAGTERRSDDDDGWVYEAQNGGTTGGAPPTWPAAQNATVNDNGITWQAVRRTLRLTDMRLATTQAGLDAATPGAALGLGTSTLPGGVANGVQCWARINAPAGVITSAELYVSVEHLALQAA